MTVQIDLQRLLNYLLVILSIAGGIVSGLLAGRMMQLSFEDGTTFVPPPVAQQLVVPRLQEDDFQIILQRNLFNSAATGSAAEPVDLSSPAVAVKGGANGNPLNRLVLVGTVVAGDSSFALIKSGAKVAIFKLGAELAPGVVVNEIGRKRVGIKDHGVSRELLLPQQGRDSRRIGMQSSPSSTGGIVAVAPDRWRISKTVADHARANLSSLLQTARMVPQVENGKTVGFKLVELKNGSLLEKVGLRVGDLLVEINQLKLNSPGKALQIFQQLREAENITLGLLRNGKPKTFEYSFE